MDFKVELNSKEKLAREVTGPDTEAVYKAVSDKAADDKLRTEKRAKHEQDVDDLQKRFQEQLDDMRKSAEKISADLGKVEIMPLGTYVLVQPFKANPFQSVKTESGLIIGGFAPVYKSAETGQAEEEQPFVRTGLVVETGPDCRFVREGDIVMYNVSSEITVPFFRFGFVTVAEQRVIAAVNEGLTARKESVRQS